MRPCVGERVARGWVRPAKKRIGGHAVGYGVVQCQHCRHELGQARMPLMQAGQVHYCSTLSCTLYMHMCSFIFLADAHPIPHFPLSSFAPLPFLHHVPLPFISFLFLSPSPPLPSMTSLLPPLLPCIRAKSFLPSPVFWWSLATATKFTH